MGQNELILSHRIEFSLRRTQCNSKRANELKRRCRECPRTKCENPRASGNSVQFVLAATSQNAAQVVTPKPGHSPQPCVADSWLPAISCRFPSGTASQRLLGGNSPTTGHSYRAVRRLHPRRAGCRAASPPSDEFAACRVLRRRGRATSNPSG